MASSSAPVHPARYLSVFLVMLIGIYLLVFFTGDKHTAPKLGIDLQGGTRVTLTARTPDGSARAGKRWHRRSKSSARGSTGWECPGRRWSSTVTTWSSRCPATTAARHATSDRPLGCTSGRCSTRCRRSPQPKNRSRHPAPNRSRPVNPPHRRQPNRGAGFTATWGPTAALSAGPGAIAQPDLTGQPPPAPPAEAPATDPRKDLAERIAQEKKLRQSTNQYMQMVALQFQATRCESDDILAGNDDPKLPLVTCSTDHKTAYLLAPSIISGDQIQNATSGMDQRGIGYVVDLQFKGPAANIWADYTAAHIGTQTAFTLDSQVVSAPQIQEAIPGGRTQISGGDPPFTAATARQLANVLKYGSLPLSFEPSEAQTVSATLGLSSLRAGMIAGAIGLLLVLVYSLLYYRVLGLLTALSLVASGSMVFAILVLLGRYINYTLDLAGIAGLIIGIGTTADSFVVFFERIKDEIREGRSFRSAVPRGWARARKTIVSGNAVTFLAAAVLYFLAIGQVKGFAFTLGLTTILDLVVVFLVTWPLVYLASKSSLLAKPAYNGLGAVQQVARERRAMARTGRG
ncbi:protein translocase subunit SecD [Mycobacterium tuberculosis]|nr:protein translocase subunit SecD [Mycobacterium tuberculosis]